MEEKEVMVKITDFYKELSDSANIKNTRNPDRPKGFVEIYELDKEKNKKDLIRKSNLVVYLGREWLISRAFDVNNSNITPLSNEYICWFGVGDGGCPIGDPLNPTSPTNLDTDLDNAIMINATDATGADYRLVPDVGYYKHPFNTDIEFEQDGDNYNYWLIGRVLTTLSANDANGFNLSEAGLFTAASNAGGYGGPFNLYARVTFPSIVKTSAISLLFVWYVYF